MAVGNGTLLLLTLSMASLSLAARGASRAFSAAAAPTTNAAAALNVDWAYLRSKMMTEEGREHADKARELFQRRVVSERGRVTRQWCRLEVKQASARPHAAECANAVSHYLCLHIFCLLPPPHPTQSAARSVGEPSELDWALYKSKLPELDVDAIKADYDTVLKSIPAIQYDEKADLSAHEAKEKVSNAGWERSMDGLATSCVPLKTKSRPSYNYIFVLPRASQAWASFSAYCVEKVAELKTLAAEQADHKLHRWYRRSRIWQRFPGLYEELHHKARGTWDRELWGNVSVHVHTRSCLILTPPLPE